MPLSFPRLRFRRLAYRRTFATDDGQIVLRDLHRFCMQETPTTDPNEAVFVQGMRRVFRRIATMTNLPEDFEIEIYDRTDTNEENDQ